MNYPQAVAYVLGFANYEVSDPTRARYREFNLERVRALLTLLGDPDRGLTIVHVGGTKGKGSTTAMIAAAMAKAGFRTGRYTSPHLHTIRERIAVDGEAVSEEEFARGATAMAEAVAEVNGEGRYGQLTTFEVLTALALWHFRAAGATHAVLEVGMGGRLDATNVVTPAVSVITNISLDHTEVLGETIAEIAGEKAAIIKRGVPVVMGQQQPEAARVIARRAYEEQSPLVAVGAGVRWKPGDFDDAGQCLHVDTARASYDVRIPLLGAHQMENAAAAIAACEALAVAGTVLPRQAIVDGLAEVRWPGRLETLSRSPQIVVDGAHNPHSMARLAEAVQRHFDCERKILVFGATRTKKLAEMAREMAGMKPALVIATASRHPKSLAAAAVAAALRAEGLTAQEAPGVAAALEIALALAQPEDLVLATGSLFVVAEAREQTLGIAPEMYETPGVITV